MKSHLIHTRAIGRGLAELRSKIARRKAAQANEDIIFLARTTPKK